MKTFLRIILFGVCTILLSSPEGKAQDTMPRSVPFIELRLGLIKTQLLERSFWGGTVAAAVFPGRKWSSGISLAGVEPKLGNEYALLAAKPRLTFAELLWDNRYQVYEKSKFSLTLQLSNGLAIATLRDDAIRERVYAARGTRYQGKKVASGYYYVLQPGIQAAWHLAHPDASTDVLLTTQALYRMTWGHSSFVQTGALRGTTFCIGIAIRGLY